MLNEVYGTLAITVHVVDQLPEDGRGRAERHRKVVVYRRHSIGRTEAADAARTFAEANQALHDAGLFAEWMVRETIDV